MAQRRRNIAPVSALLLLCLLWALPSLRSDLLPGSTSAPSSSSLAMRSIPLALFAVIAFVTALVRKARWPSGKMLGAAVLVGFGLFVVPAVLIHIARGEIDDSTRVVLFSLAPVFAIVFEPYVGSASSTPHRSALAASLVAVAGTMIVFPLNLPQSSAAALAFCGVVVAVASVATANCIAVRIASDQTAQSLLTFASIASGSAAICLALLRRSVPAPRLACANTRPLGHARSNGVRVAFLAHAPDDGGAHDYAISDSAAGREPDRPCVPASRSSMARLAGFAADRSRSRLAVVCPQGRARGNRLAPQDHISSSNADRKFKPALRTPG